jgi:hypothetical protein
MFNGNFRFGLQGIFQLPLPETTEKNFNIKVTVLRENGANFLSQKS